MLQCQAPPRHPNFLSHRPYQEHIYHSEGLRPQAAQALPCLASPRVQSPATGSAGLSGTISLEAIQLSTCQPGPPPRLVWSQEPGFSLLQRWPPSLCPSPALLLEECSPSPIPTSALSPSPPPPRSGPQQSPAWPRGRGRRGWEQGGEWTHPGGALAQFCSCHLVQDLGLMVVEPGGRRRTSGRLAFPAQLCGCLSCSALSKGGEQRSL